MEQGTTFTSAFLSALQEDCDRSKWSADWRIELERLAFKRGRKLSGTPSVDELKAWGLTDEHQLLSIGVTAQIDVWELWRWAERAPDGKLRVWAELVHREGLIRSGRVLRSIALPLKLLWTRERDPYPRFFVAAYWAQKAIRTCPELMEHLEASGLFERVKSPHSGLVFARLVMAVAGHQLHNAAGELDELDRLEVAHLTRCSMADRAELLAVITKREHQELDDQAEASAA